MVTSPGVSALDFLSAPLAISEEGLRFLARHCLQARDGQPLQSARLASTRGDVAIIPISGPLMRRESIWSFFFGSSSYEAIRKDLQLALENPDVRSIVLDVDSPGGEVAGCGELSRAIFEARSKKKVVAYVTGMACSAAYWISSACSEIVADPSAQLGSIGVRTMLTDDSKRDEMQGLKEYNIVSSQSPYKVTDPAEPKDRTRIRNQMTEMASVFVSDVARNRAVSEATVLSDFGQGDVLIGKKAVSAGLADRLGDFEQLLAELEGEKMASKKEAEASAPTPAAVVAKMKDASCSGCDRDMDDDDDMYCRACYGDADAKSACAALLASTEKKSLVEALGVLSAWKELAAESAALKAQIEEQKKAAEAAQFDAEITAAKANGLLAKSDEHKRNRAALAYRGKPGAIDGLKAFLAALDPMVAPAATVAAVQPSEKSEPAKLPVGELSDEAVKMIQALGGNPADHLAYRKKYYGKIFDPASVNNTPAVTEEK